MLSFAITAVVCAFTALCYAEMGRWFRFRDRLIHILTPHLAS